MNGTGYHGVSKNLGYLLWLFKVCPLLAHEENYCLASLQQIGQESGNIEVVCIVPRVVSLGKINSSHPQKKNTQGHYKDRILPLSSRTHTEPLWVTYTACPPAVTTPHKGKSTGWVVKTLTFHKGKNFMKPDRDKKLKPLTLLSCAFPLQLATMYSVSLDVTFLRFLMANLSHFGVLPGQRRRW